MDRELIPSYIDHFFWSDLASSHQDSVEQTTVGNLPLVTFRKNSLTEDGDDDSLQMLLTQYLLNEDGMVLASKRSVKETRGVARSTISTWCLLVDGVINYAQVSARITPQDRKIDTSIVMGYHPWTGAPPVRSKLYTNNPDNESSSEGDKLIIQAPFTGQGLFRPTDNFSSEIYVPSDLEREQQGFIGQTTKDVYHYPEVGLELTEKVATPESLEIDRWRLLLMDFGDRVLSDPGMVWKDWLYKAGFRFKVNMRKTESS